MKPSASNWNAAMGHSNADDQIQQSVAKNHTMTTANGKPQSRSIAV